MASETCHVHLAIREFGVDLLRHRNHHQGDALFGVIIAGKVSHHVAEDALLAEASVVGAHGRLEAFRFEDFQVLGVLERAGALFPFFLRGKREAHY